MKGVEEIAGVEADSANSMGSISSAAPETLELCTARMQPVNRKKNKTNSQKAAG